MSILVVLELQVKPEGVSSMKSLLAEALPVQTTVAVAGFTYCNFY